MRTLSPFLAIAAVFTALSATTASAQSLPESCTAHRAADPSAPDGTYTIYPLINGGPGRAAFAVYCHDMTGTPKEYLTLQNTGGPTQFPFAPVHAMPASFFAGSYNFSSLEANGSLSCVVTTWQKVRLLPGTLQVQTDDFTFSETVSLCGGGFAPIVYGTAAGCQGAAVTAYANVNLEGTPFRVQETFTLAGTSSRRGFAAPPDVPTHPGFGPTYSPLVIGQDIDLGGGGGCGNIQPTNPTRLQLAFNGWMDTTGTQGPQGLPGAPGPVGAQGQAGPMGPQGAVGATGLNGLDGTQGPAGPQGPSGPAGAQGPAGANGNDGAQGPAGPAGAQGAAGPQGPIGPQGPAGPAGLGPQQSLLMMPQGVSPGAGYRRIGEFVEERIEPDGPGGQKKFRMVVVLWQKL